MSSQHPLIAPAHLVRQVDTILGLFSSLTAAHASVAARTTALHGTCDRLVAERSRLVDYADAIRQRLNYFDELERVSSQFHAATQLVRKPCAILTARRAWGCIDVILSCCYRQSP